MRCSDLTWEEIERILENLLPYLVGPGLLAVVASETLKRYFRKKHEFELVRYSRLFEERVQVIKVLYEKLVQMNQAMVGFMSPVLVFEDKKTEEDVERCAQLFF